jgi:amidase
MTLSSDLSFTPAEQLADAVRRREVSSRELLEHFLARVEVHDPAINAVVALDVERARDAAATADELTAAGEATGPLHGVPLTVKDVFETAGLVTTAGVPELKDHVPERDAVVVGRLRRAGAVIFGKTNTPAWAGDLQTYNDLYGRTNNPWDLDRTPGGSSGGSAAAVAAGLSPLELGSDIGGSIRNPAHFCGVYGLKPSWGVVPSRGHIPGLPGSLVETDVNCVGPIGRTVADLALAFEVVAGPLPEQAVGWHLDLPRPDPGDQRGAGVAGLRLAVTLDDPAVPVASAVRARLRAFVDRLADAGAHIEERPLPVPLSDGLRLWQDLVLPIMGTTLPEELYRALAGAIPAPGGDPDDAAARSLRALVETYRDWARADRRRRLAMVAWADTFTGFDAVLAPVMPTEAFPHDTERSLPERTLDVDGHAVWHAVALAWCGAVGVVHVPVVTLPTGPTPGGLPVGVQVIGPYLHDRRLLALADRLDAVAGGPATPPGY